jgi:hypothetical protein
MYYCFSIHGAVVAHSLHNKAIAFFMNYQGYFTFLSSSLVSFSFFFWARSSCLNQQA